MDALDQITDTRTVDAALAEAIARLEALTPSAERTKLLSDARHYHGVILSWAATPPDDEQQFRVIANVMHLLATIRAAATVGAEDGAPSQPRSTQTVPPPRPLGRVNLASIPPPADSGPQQSGPSTPRGSGIRRLRPHLKSWDPVAALPGVRLKRLSTKAPTSVMLRLDPGARLPRYRHGSREHIFVLDGVLQHGETELFAGEHVFIEPGALSGPFASQGECTVMLVGSDRPELRN